MQATRNTKFKWSPLVCKLGQQVTNTVDVMVSGQDPLIQIVRPINDSPNKFLGVVHDDFQVVAKSLKTVPTPDVEASQRMSKRSEILVENILMENGAFMHSDIPMRR